MKYQNVKVLWTKNFDQWPHENGFRNFEGLTVKNFSVTFFVLNNLMTKVLDNNVLTATKIWMKNFFEMKKCWLWRLFFLMHFFQWFLIGFWCVLWHHFNLISDVIYFAMNFDRICMKIFDKIWCVFWQEFNNFLSGL